MENNMLKMLALFVVVLAICSAGALATYTIGKYFDERINEIDNFDECVQAGNSAVAGHPTRCIDSEGNVFVNTP